MKWQEYKEKLQELDKEDEEKQTQKPKGMRILFLNTSTIYCAFLPL
ncbi:hypothetical protein [Mesomycoplasma ovipneumoniae]|nr:hypothetical protein [Mesomycoplasma ovipneumoniae]MDW2923366.1 hypothetical protein [Mesomycoplasma ovipneumoniae]